MQERWEDDDWLNGDEYLGTSCFSRHLNYSSGVVTISNVRTLVNRDRQRRGLPEGPVAGRHQRRMVPVHRLEDKRQHVDVQLAVIASASIGNEALKARIPAGP
jgi:hypothetical protein